MKRAFPVLVIALLILGCKSRQVSGPTVQAHSADSNLSEEIVTLSGDFQNKQGVMARISCFCSKGGTLTLESGKTVQLCFEEEVPSGCRSITVSGSMTTQSIDPGPSSPCSSGTMAFLQVSEFKCK